MAIQVLRDAKLYTAEFDLSGDMNAIALNYAAELQEDTAFGDTTRSRAGGLKTISFTADGFWSGGDGLVDEVLFLASHKVEGEDVRLLQTVRGPTVDAKDRSGRLDPLEPADLGHVLAKIRGAAQPTE